MKMLYGNIPLAAPFWIEPFEEEGSLATMRHPIGSIHLQDSIQSLKDMGVDVLVSLLTDIESTTLRLDDEEELCRDLGIEFIRFPISDRKAPPENQEVYSLINTLYQKIREQKSVVIHCKAGIGRSSAIAAAVMVMSGWGAFDAYNAISMSRGLSVPDTPEQEQWLFRFSKETYKVMA
jgi:protein-tyrosine phosphatase